MTDTIYTTDEHVALREQVARFIAREVEPHGAAWEEQGFVPREVLRKMGELGFFGITYPAEYGGSEADALTSLVFAEALSRSTYGGFVVTALVHSDMASPHLVNAGSGAQLEKYLPAVIRGERITAVAVTEPDAGSDVAGIRTRARRDGTAWLLNGAKMFITNGVRADLYFVAARTDPDAKGSRGISMFIVEKGTPGFSAKPFKTLRTAALPNVVHFEDCRIPVAQRLGPEGGGLTLCMDLLTGLRFPYSACNVGIAVAALRMAIDYSKQRKTFGEMLSRRQAIQWMLADSEVEIRAARWLIWDGAWKSGRKEDARMEASVAKLYSSEVLGRVIDRAVQIHGGYGVSKEFPLERWYREARIRRIGEGPSEVHRMVIARNLLR